MPLRFANIQALHISAQGTLRFPLSALKYCFSPILESHELKEAITGFCDNPCLETALQLQQKYHQCYDRKTALIENHDSLAKPFNKFFTNTLPDLINQYQRPINFRSIKIAQWETNLELLNADYIIRKLFREKKYHQNLIVALNQRSNPIIGSGLCVGIAQAGVYDILCGNETVLGHNKNINSPPDVRKKDYEYSFHSSYNFLHQNFLHLEACQLSDPRFYFYKEMDSMGLPGELHMLHNITTLSMQTPYQASQFIASKVLGILTAIDKPYGFALNLDRNDSRSVGHTLGIAKTPEGLFFIDSGLGIFRFGSGQERAFGDFIAWAIYEKGACHFFNKFYITNWPSIEHEFPTPSHLNKTAEHHSTSSCCSSVMNVFNSMRDLSNTMYTGAAILYSFVRDPGPTKDNVIIPLQNGSLTSVQKKIQ